jgi:hypothetical protein
MFGFTRSPTACCQQTSHSTYKRYFCGLSCRLKMDYGHAGRFLVNRDSTFLSILGSALSDQEPNSTLSTCCNPLAQPTPLTIHSGIQQYSAAVAICGLASKCADDITDTSGPRHWAAHSINNLSQSWQSTAIATLNSTAFPTKDVFQLLQQQASVETPQHTLEEASRPTALAYSTIFNHLLNLTSAPHTEGLATIGFSLGQLIYLRDAVDDLEQDLRKNHYNPLRYHSHGKCKELADTALTNFESALSDLPLLRNREILQDISRQTIAYHSDLRVNPTPKKRKRKKNKSEKRSCWDHCDCCCCDCSCGSKSKSSCDCGDLDCCSCDC